MANIKIAYGTEAQAITCSLAPGGVGLANSATVGRESTAIDNTSNLFLDALVQVQIKTGAGATGSDKTVYVYAYGTVDAATPTYSDACTGSDASVTINNPTQLRLLGAIASPTSATTYKGGPWSVAAVFGGVLPEKWGIVVINFSGTALDTTEANHKKLYQGVYATAV